MSKRIVLLSSLLVTILVFSACGHQHNWVTAKCDEPEKCSICGKTRGSAKGHTWVEATCTEPKKCSVCGETQGEALGHSTTFGKCKVCGDSVGYEIMSKIDDALDNIMNDLNKSNSYLENVNSHNLFTMLKYSANEMAKSKDDYEKVIDLCEGIDDLQTLKSLSIKARDSIPNAPAKETESEKSKFVEDTDNYIQNFKAFSEEEVNILSVFIE